MKSVLVIGLGRFGRHVAIKFNQLGNEVMAVDISESAVKEALHYIPNAQIGDCTSIDVMQELGVRNFDICVVAIGENLSTSLEITYLLKDLGAPFIIARVCHERHAKFLESMGANEVVYPEKQMANRIAIKHAFQKAYDYIEITPQFSITEMPVPDRWVGDTIEHVEIRTRYHVNILATKTGDVIEADVESSHVFKADEHILVFGKRDDLLKFAQKL